MSNKIYYKKGYKYQLKKDYECKIDILPIEDIKTEYVKLSVDGILWIKNGYAWDGPSGPAIDTKTFMRGSLVHDALYQLIRLWFLTEKDKIKVDKELKKICLEDGMNRFRANYVYFFVKTFGKYAIDPNIEKEIEQAP